ncbi:hypothetical protein B566_EDAN010832 [Ephemera danica]|nr:hypothetical protein B566_EDAN010832 [Ephemera danica]
MKINEKNLSAFATSATPIDREGYLVKKGEVNKAYQKRWFILKGNLLFYFEKRGDREPVGVIVLEGCTIDEEQFGFKIVFHGAGNRSYTLAADSQDSMEGWMKALACAGYDFMKLMVAELQRQLDDLEECGTAIPMSSSDQPLAPPRQRHNPFNRPNDFPSPVANSGAHQRSQSMRVSSSRTDDQRTRVNFHKLHTDYGRRILSGSKSANQSSENSSTEGMLITF